MKLKPVLQSLGLVAVFFTLVPFIAADYWWIRVFDFPHTQLTILTLVALVVYFVKFDLHEVRDYIFVLVLGGCFLYQLMKIYPYIPHRNYEMANHTEDSDSPKIKFFISNVLQKNEDASGLIQQIKERDADVMLFMETNERWMEDIRPAVEDYPYRLEVPLDNTYGMLLYSRLPFKNEKILYLVDDSIPSVETILRLPGGDEVKLYGIHPTPPMPQHNPSSSERDAEMMLVAKSAKVQPMPVIVAGDFNDVAWSQSTALFKDISGLLDPRVGRGFYNTFNAKNPVMRWPLDHFFASKEFRLVKIELGRNMGSDHFPAFFEVSLEPEKGAEQDRPDASQKQQEDANEQIEDGREKQAEKKEEEQNN